MGQKLALIIATAEYQDTGLARLSAPGLDAHDFAGALRSPQIGAFDSVQTLLNEAETAARRAIARFFAGRKPDDLLLLYFSGHGVRDENGQLYLAVSDTDRGLLSATAIPANFINEQMNASRSRRQVLILDCCNSGAFAQGSKAAIGGSMGIATAFEGTGYGRVVLTATDATQYAWEGDEAQGEAANSVFTHFLVKGLETGEADANHDGRITLDELYDYVYEQVVKQTPRQTPRKFAYNQQGEVVIANNPRPVVGPVELPPELRQAVESPLVGVREAAVAELGSALRGSHRGLALAALEALERLSQDDSRRVSAAAAVVLAANAEAQRLAHAEAVRRDVALAEKALAARQQIEIEQRAAEQAYLAEKAAAEEAAAQQRAVVEAEQARVDRERAEAAEEQAARQRALEQAARAAEQQALERQARAKLEAAHKAAAAEQHARERAAQTQRLNREQIEARLRAAQKPAAPAPAAKQPADPSPADQAAEAARLALLPAAEVVRGPVWPYLTGLSYAVLCAIGWGLAWNVRTSVYDLIKVDGNSELMDTVGQLTTWLILYTAGGTLTGAILALARPRFRGWRLPLVAAAWFAAGALGWAINWVVGNSRFWYGSPWVGLVLVGGLGGAVIAALLLDLPLTASTLRRLGMIVVAWSIATVAPELAGALIPDFFTSFLRGALTGAIGGGVMFRLLWSVPRGE